MQLFNLIFTKRHASGEAQKLKPYPRHAVGMTTRERIYLTWSYGKGQFIIGLAYNLICARYLALGISYAFFVETFIIKAFLYAITLFFFDQFRSRDAIFFYINLGLSRRKLQRSILLTDFLTLAILLSAVLLIYG